MRSGLAPVPHSSSCTMTSRPCRLASSPHKWLNWPKRAMENFVARSKRIGERGFPGAGAARRKDDDPALFGLEDLLQPLVKRQGHAVDTRQVPEQTLGTPRNNRVRTTRAACPAGRRLERVAVDEVLLGNHDRLRAAGQRLVVRRQLELLALHETHGVAPCVAGVRRQRSLARRGSYG